MPVAALELLVQDGASAEVGDAGRQVAGARLKNL